MSMRRATSFTQSIDDHEDGMSSFVGDDNTTSLGCTPDCTDELYHSGVSPALQNAPTAGTPGLTSSAAVQFESETAQAQKNGVTGHSVTPGQSDDEALASAFGSVNSKTGQAGQ
jgi:hypothetical protein